MSTIQASTRCPSCNRKFRGTKRRIEAARWRGGLWCGQCISTYGWRVVFDRDLGTGTLPANLRAQYPQAAILSSAKPLPSTPRDRALEVLRRARRPLGFSQIKAAMAVRTDRAAYVALASLVGDDLVRKPSREKWVAIQPPSDARDRVSQSAA
jgi:hypothetical protein